MYHAKKLFPLLIAAVLFCGCTDYGSNMPIKYKAFLKYTFDKDYSIEQTAKKKAQSENELNYRSWSLYYTDHSGKKQEGSLTAYPEGSEAYPEAGGYWDNELFSSDIEMCDFVLRETEHILFEEFSDELASSIFPDRNKDYYNKYVYAGKGDKRYELTLSVYYRGEDIKNIISAKNGIKLKTIDLSSAAKDKDLEIEINLSIHDESSVEQFKDQFLQLQQAYIDYTENPCNYSVSFKTSRRTVYDKHYIDGQLASSDMYKQFAQKSITDYISE